MSKYWSATTRKLTPYVPGEQPKLTKLVKLNTNENPYPPSPKAVAAMQAELGADGGLGVINLVGWQAGDLREFGQQVVEDAVDQVGLGADEVFEGWRVLWHGGVMRRSCYQSRLNGRAVDPAAAGAAGGGAGGWSLRFL
jgi:hypothetical protein